MNYTLTRIKQHFKQNTLTNVQRDVRQELIKLRDSINPDTKIAIAVGSRGIDNQVTVIREVIDLIRSRGATPFIIPAMGSHGGATAKGQEEILASYGISEAKLGVPVRSSMEVVTLPGGDSQNPAFMDRYGFKSDGIILINRIKPHTDYHGEYESGLVKMAVIGLGKEKGASSIHSHGVYGLTEMLRKSAKIIFGRGKIIGGVALVENAYDHTMLVKALKGEEIMEKEPDLLKIAVENMPTFPVKEFDVLIIDEMGKNISGVCIDTNIIGRMMIRGQNEPESPDIKSIIVLDLTEESHGNALGVGLADIITRHLYEKIDLEVTYKNVYTASFLARAKIPIIADNGRIALDFALRSCGVIPSGDERIVRIKNTLHLDDMYVSPPVLEEIKSRQDIEILNGEHELINGKNDFFDF